MIKDRPGREPHCHEESLGEGEVILRDCEELTCFGNLLSGGRDLRGTPRLIANTDVYSRHLWHELTFVQGGARGVVFGKDGARRTAFVEAFPRGTFIRGEGATIEEADDACWANQQKIDACHAAPDHGPFERRGYTNGAGYCDSCGGWFSGVFEPIDIQGPRKPALLDRILSDNDDAEKERLDVIAEVLSAKVDADAESGALIQAAVRAVLGTDPGSTEK